MHRASNSYIYIPIVNMVQKNYKVVVLGKRSLNVKDKLQGSYTV